MKHKRFHLIFLLFTLLFLSLPVEKLKAVFGSASSLATGRNPLIMVSGLFDNNADLDLAVINGDDNNVRVFLGSTGTSFGAGVNYSASTSPTGLAAFDSNNDTEIDLAIANSSSDNFTLLRGTGLGTFAYHATIATGDNPSAIIAAELNGDAYPELAVTNFNQDNVSVFKNANGSLALNGTVSAGNGPVAIISGNFTADTNVDLIVANSLDNNISVLRGNGDRTFQAAINYNVGADPNWLIAGDYDGDNDQDLAVVCQGSQDIYILQNNGSGVFTTLETYSVGLAIQAGVSGDFNDDGDLDLLISETGSDKILLFLNKGNALFSSASQTISPGLNPYYFVAGDFDADGLTDFAVDNNSTATISVFKNNFSPGVTVTASAGSTDVSESGTTDTYTIALNDQPHNSVNVNITTGSQTTVSSAGLTFSTSNWATPQTITVSAVDDQVAEGDHTANLTHAVTSADDNYNGLLVNNLSVNLTDNDTAGITVNESSGSTQVTEGVADDSYTLVLTSEPTDNVTLSLSPDSNDLSLNTNEIVFTSANWDEAQTITVSAPDDLDIESTETLLISHTVASSDGNYNGMSIRSVSVLLTDNDFAHGIPVITGPLYIPGKKEIPNTVATTTLPVVISPTSTVPETQQPETPELYTPPVPILENKEIVKEKFTFWRFLGQGANGHDVKTLQKTLNSLGFKLAESGPGSPGEETDYFGNLTKKALIKFQEAHWDFILKPWGLTKGTGFFGKYTKLYFETFLFN